MIPRPPLSTLFPYTTLFRSLSTSRRITDEPSPLYCVSAFSDFALPAGQQAWSEASADRKSTRLNSSHQIISYAVFCLKKKKKQLYTFLLTVIIKNPYLLTLN